MTDRKEKILAVALELFANEGYNAVSTSRIAKQAEVSEGLIFRHFETKKGLLDAIMKQAEERLGVYLKEVFVETDPKAIIRRTIEMPFKGKEEEYDYWRLQFMLKWQKEYKLTSYRNPMIDKLSEAFRELGVIHPEKEARLLNQMLESITSEIIRYGKESQLDLREFLMKKYGV